MVDLIHFKELKPINYDASIYYLLLLHDGRIASCSWASSVNIINIDNDKCELTLTGHQDTVTYISQLENGKLVTCSRDKSIKIWLITKTTVICEETIEDAHSEWINKIIPLSKDRMGSCSNDKTIKIWSSSPPYTLISTLTGHKNLVSSIIQLKGQEFLLSGADDGTMRIWSLSSFLCVTLITDIYYNRKNVIEIGKYIAIACGNNIKLINSQTFQIEKSIEDNRLGIVWSLIELRDNNILCGNSEGRLCLYNIDSNTVNIKDNAHEGGISSLMNINDHTFLSGSSIFSIKMWNY